MTEAEWFSVDGIAAMVQHLRGVNATERKLRLFALECVRRIRHYLKDERSIRALEFAEANVEKPFKGLRNRRAIESAAMMAAPVTLPGQPVEENELRALAAAHAARMLLDEAWVAALHCSHQTAEVSYFLATQSYDPHRDPTQPNSPQLARASEIHLHAEWLRDIFGNPFRKVKFDPTWCTDTAVSLAKQVYEAREFGAMPILADALQDAGCDNEHILNHCRDVNQVHVRGCWVVDLVLGKS